MRIFGTHITYVKTNLTPQIIKGIVPSIRALKPYKRRGWRGFPVDVTDDVGEVAAITISRNAKGQLVARKGSLDPRQFNRNPLKRNLVLPQLRLCIRSL